MKILIVAVGRLKAGPERTLLDRYMDRTTSCGRPLGLGPVVISEIAEGKASSAALRKRDEAQKLATILPASAKVICLDETGRDSTSQSFSDAIVRDRDDGIPTLAFVVGGPDGLDEAFRKRHAALRFGQMTLPHQIVRIVLMEQIYRATTIIAGHPYHRN